MNEASPISLRKAKPLRQDQEFLPAALEILETPPSPVRTALIGLICSFVCVAIAWAYFSRIDIFAVAQGKVQPAGRSKTVQPLEPGRVRHVRVQNGSRINAGDILVELDPIEADADVAALSDSLASFRAEAARRQAAIRSARDRAAQRVDWPDNVPSDIRARETRILTNDLHQLAATLASLEAQRAQKAAEHERLAATIAAQRELIATLQERVTMRSSLIAKAAGTRASLIDATESLQYQKATLATELGQLAEAEAGLGVIAAETVKSRETFINDNSQKLGEAERQIDDVTQRLTKAKARREHMTLRSPLEGTVQASSVTTVGQVVTIGQELMRIVPDGLPLEIEAYVPNKDVGFVHPGQEAIIKIESFPFTRYGTLSGRVMRVATDAIPEPDAQQTEADPSRPARDTGFSAAPRVQNLVFPVIIKPDSTWIMADGRNVALSPGMTASVEIKTGSRRVLEYLFSPLVEVTSEAMRER